VLTTRHAPGVPVWVELTTPEVAAAATFYGALFGWELRRGRRGSRPAGPDAGGWGAFELDGRTAAVVGPGAGPPEGPDGAAWTLYFHTDDARATAAAVERAGGAVRRTSFGDDSLGPRAWFADPTAARFAVWQLGDHPGLEVVTDPGALCWAELHTTDPAAALAFYRAVLGWVVLDPPGEGAYTVVRPAGGGPGSGQGAILRGDGHPHWLPYFEVADCDAVVAEALARGGSLRTPPMDIEGVGRPATLTDPAGAEFAVLTSAARAPGPPTPRPGTARSP
jgi:uncharacterized protein